MGQILQGCFGGWHASRASRALAGPAPGATEWAKWTGRAERAPKWPYAAIGLSALTAYELGPLGLERAARLAKGAVPLCNR
eukprot:10367147-Alexandrium_andersonii.AAC.1